MLKDLRVGKEAEQELVDILSAFGGESKLNAVHANRYEYDVECVFTHGDEQKTMTFEVKNDVMSKRTGNLAIEYWNSKQNKPSGLFRTTANFWVHKFNDSLYVIPVETLKTLTNQQKPDRFISGGGDDNADLMLYQIERLENEMREISSFGSCSELYEYLCSCTSAVCTTGNDTSTT